MWWKLNTLALGLTVIIVIMMAASGSINTKHLSAEEAAFYYGEFPTNFLWGLASSAYQIEGGWNSDGKGLSIWDTYTHQQNSPINSGHTGDLACDSYNKYKEDVKLLKDMNAGFYRFSISWTRILPDGTLKSVNQAGIDYYNKLIDELLKNGIIPMVTMFHWDLPQSLMDIGGLTNEEVATHFADYARILYKNYGDRVKYWITFNEPSLHTHFGYSFGYHAPGIQDPEIAPYQCGHTIIKAHALSYRIYENEFKSDQQGIVGISLDAEWREPLDPKNPEDVAASHRAMAFMVGWFAHPLVYGEYPLEMRQLIDAKSSKEGRTDSRLPHFDENWTKIIKGSLDFIGVNQYSSAYVYSKEGTIPGIEDSNVDQKPIEEEPVSTMEWLRIVPWGLRRSLGWISKWYPGKPLYVTENGFPDLDTDGIHDPERINYFRLYTNELLKAIKIDGIDVRAYAAWSLTDNFEWGDGYSVRFGVNYINFSDPVLTRIPKDSSKFLANLFKTNRYSEEDVWETAQTERIEL